MADLKWEVALALAASLGTIGHPYGQAILNATAMDLTKWCKGAILDGRVWQPDEQALWLVTEARETWLEGWPETGGTAKLKALFREKFEPAATAPLEQRSLDPRTAVERGLLAPPCVLCPPDELFCPYGGAKRHAREQDVHVIDARPPARDAAAPAKPGLMPHAASVYPKGYADMAARAQSVYEDEQRRKRAQLEKLNLGTEAS